jgi:hypothetical protein
MKLVHFTSRRAAETILTEGLRVCPAYSPYGWAGDTESCEPRPLPELEPNRRCIFAYPLGEDDQARYNCWADVCDRKPEIRDRRPGDNTAVVFSLKDDDTVWVGAWGWPWEGYPEVDAAYLQSGMVYKQRCSFGAFCRAAATAVASIRRGTDGRLTSIYDLLSGLVTYKTGDSVDIEESLCAFLASQEPDAAAAIEARIAEDLARAEEDIEAILARDTPSEHEGPGPGLPPTEATGLAVSGDAGPNEQPGGKEEYAMESKPMWATYGFEICVVRDILPGEIEGIVDLEQLDPQDYAWYREGSKERSH